MVSSLLRILKVSVRDGCSGCELLAILAFHVCLREVTYSVVTIMYSFLRPVNRFVVNLIVFLSLIDIDFYYIP